MLDGFREIVGGSAVSADRERVYQVLSNLIGNAVKYTPEGGRIRLRVEPADKNILVTVADTGPGLLPEQLPHLFDRYWQARNDSRDGSGLALFIAKGIVEAHGGRIWAESKPGVGAIFRFTLPAG